MKNFEGYIRKFARDNNVEYEWQMLKFGYKRAVISCESWSEYEFILYTLMRRKGIHVHSWRCSDGGVFEGRVYVMTEEDYDGWKAAEKEEQRRLDDWWQRLANADEETQRLMRCGAID